MPMLVDVLSYKVFALIWGLAFAFLAFTFLIGAAGPDTYDGNSWTAYKCPKNSHDWNPDTCTGIQMAVGNDTTWSKEFPEFTAMNVLWLLDVTPYKNKQFKDSGVNEDLKLAVSIYGSSNENGWNKIVDNDEHMNKLSCDSDDDECDSFTLVDIQNLEYSFYRVEIWLPDSKGKEYVGDVEFSLFYYNRSFTDMELGFRLSYLMICLALLIIYLWRLRKIPMADWEFEQKSITLLLLALILLNDPFYPLEFWTRGWFFEFVHSVFETVFIASLFMFWLFVVEKLRKGDDMKFGLTHIPEFFFVGVFTCISTALFTLIRVRAAEDPVYGERDDVVAEIVLFYIVTISYAILVVWFLVETVMTVSVVTRQHLSIRRLVYFGIPSLLCILSIIIGMFAGTLGPFNRTSLGFVYYFAMYNSYVWVMLIGFWPAEKLGYIDPTSPEEGRETEDGDGEENLSTPIPVTNRPSERDSILRLHDNL